MMKMLLLIVLSFTCVFAFTDDFIKEINNKQTMWRAGRNFPENTTISDIQVLLGLKTLPQEISDRIPVKYHEINTGELPESFDARTHWQNCSTIRQVADQSACGASWAVAVTSAISDRICIHSDGKVQPEISARNVLACEDELSVGCNGGNPYYAWVYWKNNGLVTGGSYGSQIGCQPYPFAPCEHHIDGPKQKCPTTTYNTPECVKTCDDSKRNFEKELVYGGSAYRLYNKEEQIRAEIFKNGPVVAGFKIYTDFFQYKSGVYTYTSGALAGRQAIRIIGWGEENGTKYWLVANSWNEDWGDKGLFKIRRGQNDCDIEENITAGLPK